MIDYSLSSPQSNPPGQENPPAKKSIWKWILLYAVIAVVVCGAVYGFYFYKNAKSTDNIQLQGDAETADWKTYKNDEYGFEIKYPPYLTAGKLSENSVLGSVTNKVSGVFIGPLVLVLLNDKSTEAKAVEYFDYYYPIGPDNSGKFNNNSVQIEYVFLKGEGGPAYYAFIKNNNRSVFVDGYSKGYGGYDDKMNISDMESETIRKILYTFKFTDKKDETTNWKTYTNTEYGFEIKYPSYFTLDESGRPDLGIHLKNNNKDMNIDWVWFTSYVSMRGPITFDNVLLEIKSSQECKYESCGTTRILKSFTIDNKRAITYEGVGWPSRIPSITTVVEHDNGSVMLEVYGKKEISVESLKQEDRSDFTDLEKINNEMLSTLTFTK